MVRGILWEVSEIKLCFSSLEEGKIELGIVFFYLWDIYIKIFVKCGGVWGRVWVVGGGRRDGYCVFGV